MASSPPPIFVVSGATGASGELVVRTVLAQFHQSVPVILVPHVRTRAEMEPVVEQAAASHGIIVHTLVDSGLRSQLIDLAQARSTPVIDLMGALLEHLASQLGEQPAGRPGLYRQQREDYFERVAAIEFSVAHDDGQRIDGLAQAEIVLVGVSRTGKTPLSMYLAVLGWKVANVPLLPDVPPPPTLLQVDRRRVVGLTVQPGQLVAYRRWRQARLGVSGPSSYTDPATIYAEVEEARRFCQRHGFAIVDVTDKPVESSADEVILAVTSRLKSQPAAESSA
jgi:[pyruvate, water dikinase]-phosphate phosphotransferase / [pyruvate, water dikinase] kinase